MDSKMIDGAAGKVTVRFFGGDLVPGLPKCLDLELPEPITAEEVMVRVGQATGMSDLRVRIERFYAILVDGTSIQHLQGWSTLVRPGSSVAVVAPMGGGIADTP
jgi:molybdopterin converting factor small subunit